MRAPRLTESARRAAVGGLLAGAATWLVARLVTTASVATNLAVCVVSVAFVLVAASLAWRAGRQRSADSNAWLLMSAALVVFAGCTVAFSASEVFDLGSPWPMATGVLGLLFRLVLALAIVSFPLTASTARSRWRARLDLVLVGTTVAFLGWAWVLSDLFHNAQPSTLASRAALFALVDIVLVIILGMASLRRPAGLADPTRIVGLGLICLAVTDWEIGATLSAGATPDAAALTSFLAIACIGTGAWLAAHPSAVRVRPAQRHRARDLLPIGLAALALIPATIQIQSWDGDRVMVALAIASATSLLAWQVAMVLENEEMVDSLSEQNQRFATLVETAPIAIIETDHEGVVQIANSEAARILDQEAADLLGRHLDLETLSDEDVGLRERVLRGETLRDVRIPMRRGDGVTMDLLVSSAPITNRIGEVSGVVWTGSDDGPRLRGFAAMIAVQRMQAYEQLTSGIAHDFNNRLAVILGTTEILLDGAADADDREMLEAVLSSGRRAAALVDQLVGTTGRKSDDQEHLDLVPLLAQLEPELVRMSPRGTSVVVDVVGTELPVEADWSDLRQAIINLVANAMEASSGGGTVRVRACAATPLADGSASVELVVADDGAGMDDETRARIFEPFFTTKDGTGRSRGLGLPAVQGVVLRSRGEIQVDSEFGEGTTVTVRLPRREAPIEAAPVETALPDLSAVRTGATILLVDDEPEVRTMTGRVLAQAGHIVVAARGADEAMAILTAGTEPIDLVLSDVVMPGRSGIDLAREVSEQHPSMPILLMSGFVGESAHGGLTADLPYPLLAKPTPRDVLLAAVDELLPVLA